ncbi:LCP family protein [Streptomyces sp. NPDC005963]|uniref:LCP family protein n=1 Tax=Streptomyces sp. NPDC005963 TaxID=3156721 RepID=UPI0034117BF2
MDADVTDSAGTPTGSDGQAPDADAERATDAENGSAAAGKGSPPPGESTAQTPTDPTPGPHDDADAPTDGRAEEDGPETEPPAADTATDTAPDTAPGLAADTDADADADAEQDSASDAEPDQQGAAPAATGETPADQGADEESTESAEAPAALLAVEPKVAPDTAAVPDHPGGEGTSPPKRKRIWLRWVALGTSVVVLAASGVAWWFYTKLDANITTDTTAAAELRTYEKERPTPLVLDAQNILLLGSDTRAGKGNSKYGRDEGGSQRADTAILLHIAANRQSATAMSIPRDLMVTIPSCRKPDGSRTRKQFAQFNWAFMFGGAACSIRTVELMTGVRMDHHIVVDFRGFKKMVDAVDGVEVCLKEPIDDEAARLKLPSGHQTLDGEEALGFVRARKTLGDGSDTERMERQQQFLGSLVKKVKSNGVLLNLTKLYPVLDAATKSLTTDPGLDSLKDLYDLAQSVQSIPTEKVQFLTVPRQPYSANRNRDELVQPDARQLFKKLREDTPITVLPRGSRDESDKKDKVSRKSDGTTSASPTPSPSFTGTNAAEGLCG